MKLMSLWKLTKHYPMSLVTGVALTPVFNTHRLRSIDRPLLTAGDGVRRGLERSLQSPGPGADSGRQRIRHPILLRQMENNV